MEVFSNMCVPKQLFLVLEGMVHEAGNVQNVLWSNVEIFRERYIMEVKKVRVSP